MHEYALAEAVVATALEEAERRAVKRIRRVEVHVGELQRINPETFEFLLKELIPSGEPRLASTRFDLEVDPARFRCRPCGATFDLKATGGPQGKDASEAIHFIPELAHSFLRCPQCASPDFEICEGRGVTINAIEGE